MNFQPSKSLDSNESFSFNESNPKRLLHSDSSVTYHLNNVASPVFVRGDSVKQLLSQTMSIHEDIDTITSKSFVHGFILVAIMILSLISFITSKVRRCSDYTDVNSYENCSKYFMFYSVMTISSCMISFLIYFLHLISQCDILCLSQSKYQTEISIIALVALLQLVSLVLYYLHTDIFMESFTLASVVLACITVALYFCRMIILICETIQRKHRTARQLAHHVESVRKRNRSTASRDTVCVLTMNEALPGSTKVVSYVRADQRKKTLSTSTSDDFDDDVFIT